MFIVRLGLISYFFLVNIQKTEMQTDIILSFSLLELLLETYLGKMSIETSLTIINFKLHNDALLTPHRGFVLVTQLPGPLARAGHWASLLQL